MCIKWNEDCFSMADDCSGGGGEKKCGGLEAIHKRSQLAGRLLLQAQQLRIGGIVKGAQRVERKIKAEKAFLDSILSGERILKDTHLSSTNLTHIEAVLQIVQETEDPVAIQHCYTFVPGLGITPVSVQVDVVGGGGRWVRVFCRKRSALHRRWLGDGQFGEKSVGEIAAEYKEASKQNLHMFNPPRIFFVFFDGITESVSGVLERSGIEVVGPVYPDKSTDDDTPSVQHVMSLLRDSVSRPPSEVPPPPHSLIPEAACGNTEIMEMERVNLDVSTMLAWVSSLTHGGAIYTLQEKVLNEQAEEERKTPVWPVLQSISRGKKLMACQTAADGFSDIVGKVGGEAEKTRARALLREVKVVDDCPSSRAMALTLSHRVTHRAKVVFGSGDTLHATTLTANAGFVRAASHQGVEFAVYIHPSRALTEAKQVKSDKT